MSNGRIVKVIIEKELPDGSTTQETVSISEKEQAFVFVANKLRKCDGPKCPLCGGDTNNGVCNGDGCGAYK